MLLEALFSGTLCLYASVTASQKFVNRLSYIMLVEFHQIYDFGVLDERRIDQIFRSNCIVW